MPRRGIMVVVPSPEVADAIGRLLRADPARTLALAQSLRAPGRSVESTVTGMSMGPGLRPGSRIRIALIPRARYEAGEVVAYLTGNQVVVHRVAHRGRAAAARGYIVTRGDATLVPDPPVERGCILGPVTGVWRGGGWGPPSGPPPRSPAAKLARTVSLATAIGALYLSPRAAKWVLIALHRAAGALRVALARVRRRRSSRSPDPL